MKRLILASLAVVALASCEKESTVDSTLTSENQKMTFAPYAGASTTRGNAVNSNGDFNGSVNNPGSFEVAAYSGSTSYFGFNTVKYKDSAWENVDNMYWPNEDSKLHFGAYYPSNAEFSTIPAYSYGSDAHSLTFGYTVSETVSAHKDIMFALTDHNYTAPVGDELVTDKDEESVALHFKHALTQVGFTATKADDINVTVRSVTICNVVDNGTFKATLSTVDSEVDDDNNVGGEDPEGVDVSNFGVWTPALAAAKSDDETPTNLQNYSSPLELETLKYSIDVTAAEGEVPATQLSSKSDVMMLIPQSLKAWNAKDKAANTGVESYLAISCVITHHDGEAAIVDGTVYVPFETKNIKYGSVTADAWKAGYKITYNLHFGGGYTKPGGGEDPVPGETPNPETVVPTLRNITYTATVDEWIPVAGGNVSM